MLFRVVGIDRETGEGVDLLLEAPSLAWAHRMAEQRGIIPDSVDPARPAVSADAPRLSRSAPDRSRTGALSRPPPRPNPHPPAESDDPCPGSPSPEPAPAPDSPAPIPAGSEREDKSRNENEPVLERSSPRSSSRPFRLSLHKRPLLCAMIAFAGVLALAACLWAINALWRGAGAGGIDTYPRYLPADTQFIAFFNVDALRGTAAYPHARDAFAQAMPDIVTVSLDQIEHIFIAGSPQGPVLIVKVVSDTAVAGSLPDDVATLSIEGYSVISAADGSCGARIGTATYLIARSQQALGSSLRRASRPETEPAPEMRDALQSMRASDSYLIVSGDLLPDTGLQLGTLGFSIADAIAIDGAAAFGHPDQAAEAFGRITALRQQARMLASLAGRSIQLLRLLENLQVSREADRLTIQGSLELADIQELLPQVLPLLDLPGSLAGSTR